MGVLISALEQYLLGEGQQRIGVTQDEMLELRTTLAERGLLF